MTVGNMIYSINKNLENTVRTDYWFHHIIQSKQQRKLKPKSII